MGRFFSFIVPCLAIGVGDVRSMCWAERVGLSIPIVPHLPVFPSTHNSASNGPSLKSAFSFQLSALVLTVCDLRESFR